MYLKPKSDEAHLSLARYPRVAPFNIGEHVDCDLLALGINLLHIDYREEECHILRPDGKHGNWWETWKLMGNMGTDGKHGNQWETWELMGNMGTDERHQTWGKFFLSPLSAVEQAFLIIVGETIFFVANISHQRSDE